MMRVIIESPYAGDVDRNKEYLRRCVMDSLDRGEAPFASHGFYTQYLDDNDKDQRQKGIVCGYEWMAAVKMVVIYSDYGVSDGMEKAIECANQSGKWIEFRHIGVNK